MTPLPQSLLARPITHRGLHGQAPGHPENSLPAFKAAIAHGFGIELDLQLSRDGEAMVFHDYSLERLTDTRGPVAQRSARELGAIALKGASTHIPTLREVLALVAGRAPLLIELKDQDGALGPNVGRLEAATAAALADYEGEAALMSFNPHSTIALAALGTHRALGLTTCDFSRADWPTIPEKRLAELRPLPDLAKAGASFISHDVADLASPHVATARARGLDVLCWTVKSEAAEVKARKYAQNITFEGYLPH